MRLPTSTPLPDGGDVNPTQSVPVVRERDDGAGREVALLSWGLLPPWAESKREARKLFNVRGETARSKFRGAFDHQRCVVPARGFYEWKEPPPGISKKIPHLIHDRARPVFSMAGLWSAWREPTGQTIETCTVVTTMASAKIQPLHHRMPVILDDEAANLWLEPGADPADLEALLIPFDGPTLEVEPMIDIDSLPVQESLF